MEDILKELQVRIKVHSLKRHDKSANWRESRPYLWNIFFKVDGTCLTITNNFKLEVHSNDFTLF